MTKPLATALSEVRNRDRRIAKLEKQFSALQAENAKLQAALRASTELMWEACLPVALHKRAAKLQPQIAANEAVLGDNNGTDQK